MQLIELAGNAAPPGAVVRPVMTADGVALRVAHWGAKDEAARGTILIMQGRTEFIEKYFEVIGDLRARRFAVVAFDWRGQGGSARHLGNPRKGHVGDFEEYRRDLDAVRAEMREAAMPPPWFGLAHSMGGAIALTAAHDGVLPCERLVACAPMIDLAVVASPRLAVVLARLLKLAGFGTSFVPGGGETALTTRPFPGNPLTSDPQRYARSAAAAAALGEWGIGDPTVGWLDAAYQAMRRFRDPRFAPAIRTPTLIVAAGADPICSTAAIERFATRLKAGHALVIPGARHEILIERDAIRAQFWAAFDAFIPGSREALPSAGGEQFEHAGVEAGIAGRDD